MGNKFSNAETNFIKTEDDFNTAERGLPIWKVNFPKSKDYFTQPYSNCKKLNK